MQGLIGGTNGGARATWAGLLEWIAKMGNSRLADLAEIEKRLGSFRGSYRHAAIRLAYSEKHIEKTFLAGSDADRAAAEEALKAEKSDKEGGRWSPPSSAPATTSDRGAAPRRRGTRSSAPAATARSALPHRERPELHRRRPPPE